MAQTLDTYADGVLKRVPHLHAVVISDRDGVVLVKATDPTLPPKALEPALAAAFASASDQASRLVGLGKNLVVATTYDRFQVVQFNQSPLIVTLVAGKAANTGILLDVGREVCAIAQPVATALQESLSSK